MRDRLGWMLGALEADRIRRRPVSAVQVLALSFAGLIAIGTAGFLTLPGLYTGPRLGALDALFTATSAVCVTGLIVVDTATYFTPLGQAWIALLIQLGGLGILTVTTLLIAALGGRTSLYVSEAARPLAPGGAISGRRLVVAVVLLTGVAELAGTIVLWLAWIPRFGAAGAIWPAAFHAISAFCNAGFSTFADSLEGFRRDPLTLGVIGALILIGGIGFVVLVELRARILTRRIRRVSTHVTLVVGATAVLLVLGAILFLAFEWSGQLAGLGPGHRLANAVFMAITPRTAGFNTVDYDLISDPSLVLTLLLMAIGGSPGSTAGGIKTSTAALLALLLLSRLRGGRHVALRGRSVPDETVNRAAGLAVGAATLLAMAVLLLAAAGLESAGEGRMHLTRMAFEATSAFGTVGLSMGGTGLLNPFGKLVVTALMFIGRVGPATIAAAMVFARGSAQAHFRYAYEDVAIG